MPPLHGTVRSMSDFADEWIERELGILSLMKPVFSREELGVMSLMTTLRYKSYKVGLTQLEALLLDDLQRLQEFHNRLQEVRNPKEDTHWWAQLMEFLPHAEQVFDDVEMLQRFEAGGPADEVRRRLLEIGDKLQRTEEDDAFVDTAWNLLQGRGLA